VPLSEIAADPALLEQIRAEVGEDGAAALANGGAAGTALIKDETICIRCGLCAERCPAGTITMEQFLLMEPAHV
jgi:ferredoxin